MTLRAAELEVLITVDDKQVDTSEKKIKATGQRIEKNPLKVDADAKGALASMDRVEAQGKRIVTAKTIATVDANIDRAEKSFVRVYERLDYLRSVETELNVSADIARAEAQMQRVERQLEGLRNARTVMELEADPEPAESKFKSFFSQFRKRAEDAGTESGRSLSKGLDSATRGAGEKVGDVVGGEVEDTLVSALAAIPIAGGIILAGVAIGKAVVGAINDGLQVEKSYDRLAALTGLEEADALRLGRAAGEAYANVFGESIESNMDIVRTGIQFDLIDEKATTSDAQKVVQSLAGIADVLGEDVQPIARATTQAIRTGLVDSAEEFFDVLAAGSREGVNISEDLLDTFIEYSTHFRDLGLGADEALGLLNQGLEGGAFNADKVADALKELTIRVKDLDDEAAREAMQTLGLNADEMARAFAEGGPKAREGLEEILTKLQEVEDPAERARLAVKLFGTQAEDMGQALGNLNLSTAVEQLNGVEGAAKRMFDTLADNDATKMEQAQRNIEVASDGIKGALAVAFSEPLGDFADWVSQNRGPLLQFFSDLVNGAIDFGISSTESFGAFVAGPLADTVEGVAGLIDVFNGFEGRPKEIDDLAASMRGFEDGTDATVDKLEEMRGQFNGFADDQIKLGYLNDASLRLADAIGAVGSESGDMEGQVRSAIAALSDQIDAAEEAGDGQSELSERYREGRDALIEQMIQMDLTKEEAQALIDTVLKTPDEASTEYGSNATEEERKVQSLSDRVDDVNGKSAEVKLTADTSAASTAITTFINKYTGQRIRVYVDAQGGTEYRAAGTNIRWNRDGALLEFMASGGLTPMAPVAQMVPPNTWRVVGDRGDVPELYAPLDGSARSWSLLMEGLRRMPGSPSPGASPARATSQVSPIQVVDNATYYAYDPHQIAVERDERLRRSMAAAGLL